MTDHGLILVAEDEESDVELLRIAIKKSDLPIQLVVAQNGEEAIKYLDPEGRMPGQPARPMPGLLLLDLKMPRMTGFDVLAWLGTRPELKGLPAVVLSSSTHDSDIQKAREMGAREYLVKPASIGELMKIAQDLHARYLAPTKAEG